jgi:hypothetical protein
MLIKKIFSPTPKIGQKVTLTTNTYFNGGFIQNEEVEVIGLNELQKNVQIKKINNNNQALWVTFNDIKFNVEVDPTEVIEELKNIISFLDNYTGRKINTGSIGTEYKTYQILKLVKKESKDIDKIKEITKLIENE